MKVIWDVEKLKKLDDTLLEHQTLGADEEKKLYVWYRVRRKIRK